MWLLVFQSLSFEFLWHIIFFPIWWYSAGTIRAAKSAIRLLAEGNDILVPGLWAKNIFTPMFGQTDWQGRMVSFFIRFVNVIIRSILLLFWLLIAIIIFLLWLVIPLFVLAMFIRSLIQ
jgi:hypothetical protein